MTLRLVSLRAVATCAAALLAMSVRAAGPGLAPVAEPLAKAPVGIGAVAPGLVIPQTPRRDLAAEREALQQHLKALGIPADAIEQGLARIDIASQQGMVVDAVLQALAAQALDAEGAERALLALTAFAEMAAFGEPITADFVVDGIAPVHAMSPRKEVIQLPGEIIGDIVGPVEPRIGGVCQLCPNFDFGPFTPSTTVYQFHTSALVSGFPDCAWYQFNVVAGNLYEFTTCAPGAALFDTFLELWNPAACGTRLAANDDCPSSGSLSTLQWNATYTGVAHLRLRGFTNSDGGPYTLAYKNLGIVCESCANPNPAALPNPTGAYECVSGMTDANCTSDFFTVNLVANESYVFTTCPTGSPATANYDTLLRIWDPACSAGPTNDNTCTTAGQTTRSTLLFTATSTGPHRIEVTGFTSSGVTRWGTYTLCYRRTSVACATCAGGPYRGTFSPLPTCTDHASTVTACQDSWYQFVLTGGKEYEFTTCSLPGGCLNGQAMFDTVLELHNSGCVQVASDDDGCGGVASKLTYAVPTGAGGVYKLLVRGDASATGGYTLTYRELTQSCVAPTACNVAPGGGTTGLLNCARTEAFTLSVNGTATLPITYSWAITPPVGGVAAPPSGIVTSSAPNGASGFTSTLTGEGVHRIEVTATNSCGAVTQVLEYVLTDEVRPTITAPTSGTVECDAVPAAEDPLVRDNCDPSPAVALTETSTPGACPGSYVLRREWVATDRSGNSSSTAVQVITVRDRTPPTLTADTSARYCVYPPNHDVACFDTTMFSPVVTDACSLPVTWRFARVTSSEEGLEPCGSGNQDPDTFVAPDGQTFCIRAERCGNDPAENDGRRYLVEATATDACGNTSEPIPIGYILVPHDSADTTGCIYPIPIELP